MENSSSCTRCGSTKHLIDITHYEFPDRQGLLFECLSCGNNSIRSNISDDERQRRLALIASEQFVLHQCPSCPRCFHSFNDYQTHLKCEHPTSKEQN